MIIGIGCDITEISRIGELYKQKKDIFLLKILTKNEIIIASKITNHKNFISHLANRFAAKEAFSKALGSGIGKVIGFKDLEVEKAPSGKPYFNLSSKLSDYIKEIYGSNVKIHLSMSNEQNFAQAFVIIEN